MDVRQSQLRTKILDKIVVNPETRDRNIFRNIFGMVSVHVEDEVQKYLGRPEKKAQSQFQLNYC